MAQAESVNTVAVGGAERTKEPRVNTAGSARRQPSFGGHDVAAYHGATNSEASSPHKYRYCPGNGVGNAAVPGVNLASPVQAIDFESGFVVEPLGTLTSRTIMLDELVQLLAACSSQATPAEYRAAVVDGNVLGKRTVSTRRGTYRFLRELYGLDLALPVFRGLRALWDVSTEARPILALLCAIAREPLLRSTADAVLATQFGAELTTAALVDRITEAFPGRYAPGVQQRIARNIASSWQQSGHLSGRLRKIRTRVTATPPATAYALLLGHLDGARGTALFSTLWARLLDASPSVLDTQAFTAAQRGWLDYRRIGDVADISFSALLEPAGGGYGRG